MKYYTEANNDKVTYSVAAKDFDDADRKFQILYGMKILLRECAPEEFGHRIFDVWSHDDNRFSIEQLSIEDGFELYASKVENDHFDGSPLMVMGRLENFKDDTAFSYRSDFPHRLTVPISSLYGALDSLPCLTREWGVVSIDEAGEHTTLGFMEERDLMSMALFIG